MPETRPTLGTDFGASLGEQDTAPASGLRAQATPPRPFTAAASARWLLVGLTCLALLPSVLWLGAGLLLARQDALAAAYGAAYAVEWLHPVVGTNHPQTSAAQAARALPQPAARQHLSLRDAQGLELARRGDASATYWPTLTLQTQALRTQPPTTVQAHISLWPLVWTSTALLLACSALAAVLWSMARRSAAGAVRKVEGRLRAIATRDVLTGLLNREGMRQRLERLLARRRGGTRRLGLLVVDVDRFRLVNDTYGQQAGDLLLRAVAERLRQMIARDTALARLGDDQFAVLVDKVGDAQALIVLARNLLRAFETPLLVGDQETATTVSVGVTIATDEDQGVDDLATRADAALRTAKARGGSRYCVYEPSMRTDAPRRLELELRLRRALQAQEFFLVFQPIVDAGGTRTVTVEALLRWADPQHGVISPAEFVPVLEQTGLIVPAGSWVLREACTRARSWLAGGADELVLSVNVSPLQFAEPDFVALTLRTLAATGFPAERLQLELTEGLLVDPTPETLRKMDELADAGVRLAVDDFGIGYSSLAYLKRFRLHTLKVDRLFVRDVAQSASDAAIVRAIVELGHGLGLHVCAEGVETVAQWQRLRQLGCDTMQGFLFARPSPPDDLKAMLQAQAAALAGSLAPAPSLFGNTLR